MRFVLVLAMLLSLTSCASKSQRQNLLLKGNNAQVYAYYDVSGQFEYAREVKFAKGKLATRVQIMAEAGGNERLLEKTFAISSVGSVTYSLARRKKVFFATQIESEKTCT
jgi:hypothetical protein